MNIGGTRLFEYMRKKGYICKNSTEPTQKSMDLGLFKIKKTSINHSDGRISVSITPRVTGKGQQYFINKFLSQKLITV